MNLRPRWNLRPSLGFVPAAAWLTLFFLVPLFIIALISLTRPGTPVEWSFDGGGYARLFDPLYLKIIWRSAGMALLSTLICLLAGYPLAYYIARRPPGTRRILYFLVLIPLWANSLVLIYAWMVLLRPGGIFDALAHALGLAGDAPVSVLYTPTAVVIGLVYWYLPFMIYPLYASIEKFDFNLLDAAHDLGAGRMQVFWRVLLPLTAPGVVTGCLLVFIESLGAFVVPDLLGGAKTLMLGNLIQQRFLAIPQDWPMGAATAVSLLVVMGIGLSVMLRFGKAHR